MIKSNIKEILLLIAIFTLFNNVVYAKETSTWETFKNLSQYAATPEDKVLITSFSDLIKEKYYETKTYPKIVGNGTSSDFILFEDGEIVVVLNMANIKMGNNTTDDIDNFFSILTKRVGKKNMSSYYLNIEGEPNQNNIYIRLRLK